MDFNLERCGAHGLPCGLDADWNDCIRLGEQGESLFVAFQLRLGLREYIDIAARLGDDDEKLWGEKKLAEFDAVLDEHAWDGQWYLCAYRYDGLRIKPCLPQDWPEVKVKRIFRGAEYHITIQNSKGAHGVVKTMRIDGETVLGNLIIPAPAGATVMVGITLES